MLRFALPAVLSVLSLTPAHAEDYLKMATSAPGGSWYSLGAKISEIVSNSLEGVSATAVPGAGVSNVRDVSSGEVQFAFTFSPTAYDGLVGRGSFDQKNEGIMLLASTFPAAFQAVVPADSDIQSIADLQTRRLSPGKAQNSSYEAFLAVVGTYGFDADDIKSSGGVINHVDYSESVDLMKDGNIDAFIGVTNVPQGSFLQLESSMPIRFLPVDGEKREQFLEEYPGYFPMTIPAGAYHALDAPLETIGMSTLIIVNKGLSEDEVYQMTKAIWEARDDLVAVNKAWEGAELENALVGTVIPVHPGAMRYYKEMGVTN